MGDFLQLATVSHLDVYVDKPSEWEYGHHLWRSINLVVLLTEQMRQSDDPEFAAALRRIRFHEPTLEDIEMLNSRIGASLECPTSIPIIVHRHKLRDALNKERLQVASQASDIPITHCLAEYKEPYQNVLIRSLQYQRRPIEGQRGWNIIGHSWRASDDNAKY